MSFKLFAMLFAIYLVVVFLTGTYNNETTSAAAGTDYSTGTATFTNGSETVTGSGTSWDNSTMANGLIQLTADGIWCKISSVTNATTIVLPAPYTGDGGSGAYIMQASGAWGGALNEAREGEYTDFEHMMSVRTATMNLPVLGSFTIAIPDSGWVSAVANSATLTVPFLVDEGGGYMMVQYFLWAIALMGIMSLTILAISVFTGNVTWG